jgi:hypothetical protein
VTVSEARSHKKGAPHVHHSHAPHDDIDCEQFIAALADFGSGRSTIWRNSADSYLTVHDRGATQADVTEGFAGVWERLYCDWSDPIRWS